ncbi:hypothetical protein [Nocardia brasiliensis]|uniref:hypothetical protein n=1 Tax=Nocardia brasiliensis TaxID=37326 RepID=UPI0024585170|nr:hypothetical protein [Nocardia brasiliensis]
MVEQLHDLAQMGTHYQQERVTAAAIVEAAKACGHAVEFIDGAEMDSAGLSGAGEMGDRVGQEPLVGWGAHRGAYQGEK